MPAVSKKQQKFFGIVRSVQKGEQSPTTPEVAKAASSMKKSDVKKFASTKHKGLPMKKEINEFINFKWDAKERRDALTNAQKDHTIWKPGIDIPGIDNANKVDITKGTVEGPIKDKTQSILKTAGGLKKGIDWIGKNPGKTAAIGAGVVGAGMLAKRALSGKKKKKEVKESAALKKVINTVRGKKPEEKKPQKAMDAGARGRRLLKRREYRAKISPFIPKELED